MTGLKKLFKNRFGHFRAGWRIIFYIAAGIPLFKLLDLFGDSALMAPGDNPGDYALLVTRFIMKFLVFLAVLLPGLALLKWVDKRPKALLGTGFYRGAVKELGTGMLLGFILLGLTILVLWASGAAVFTFNGISPGMILYLAAVLAVLAVSAAYEETLFRGYVFQALIEGSGFWIALAVYSLLFGAAHLSNDKISVVSIAVTIAAGAFLGMVYYKTRALWMGIGAHFIWNWMIGPVTGLSESKFLRRTLFSSRPAASGPFAGLKLGTVSDIILGILCLALTIYLWKAKWLKPAAYNQKLWSAYPSKFGAQSGNS
jgi:membrane protease YdiL (CAAX protease family)